jgi:DNA polymerase I
VPVLAEMEMAGIKRRPRRAVAHLQRLRQKMAALEAEIHDLAGRALQRRLAQAARRDPVRQDGPAGGKKGKTGAYATGADVLEDLAAEGHDLPARVLDWRQLSKLKSTYTDALQDHINPETGRVHTSFRSPAPPPGGSPRPTRTCRTSPCAPRRAAASARPSSPSRATSRLAWTIQPDRAAHPRPCRRHPALKQAFRDGLDIHAMTASEMFGVPIEGMDPMVRRQAKAINFGVIYGISAFGLAATCASRARRRRLHRHLFRALPRHPRLHGRHQVAFAKEHGHVRDLFGRRIHTPEINAKGPGAGFARRAAINAPIQGTAADIIRRAMIRVPAAMEAAGLPARMLLQVHDELLFEVPEGAAEDTIAGPRGDGGAAHPAVQLTCRWWSMPGRGQLGGRPLRSSGPG